MRTTIQSLLSEPLMIAPTALPALLDEARADLQANAPKREAPQVRCTLYSMDGQQIAKQEQRPPGSMVAVVSLSGVMSRHGFEGYYSSTPGTLELGRQLKILNANEAVGGILIAVHSPGGAVVGTPELSDTIYGIREAGKTRIVAIADSTMASAALYAGTAAQSVYAIPSGIVGSVGVIHSYQDFSRYLEAQGISTTVVRTPEGKARFSSVEPLTDAMRQTMEKQVSESYAQFVNDLARNRGVSARHVQKRFGQGEVMTSQEAVNVGLIDGLASSVDDVLAMMIRDIATQGRRRR